MIRLSDLVSEPKLPIFELDLDIVHENILTKFHNDSIENGACIFVHTFSKI